MSSTKVIEITLREFSLKIGEQSSNLVALSKTKNDFPQPIGERPFGNRLTPLFDEVALRKWFLTYKAGNARVFSLANKTSVPMPKGQITMRGIAERMGITETMLGVLKNRDSKSFPKPLAEKIKSPYGGNKVSVFDLAEVEAWVKNLTAERATKRKVKALLPNEWDLVEKAVKTLDTEQGKLLLEKIKQLRIN
jgi:predicted DNA-binding transcriptional regulator AlpA